MFDFMLAALTVLILFTFWPPATSPVGAVSLVGAVFVAAPLGWLLAQSPMAGFGWMMLAFAAYVLTRWMREKWQAQ
jgi:hypothetical protein